jgi:hypothetical protein
MSETNRVTRETEKPNLATVDIPFSQLVRIAFGRIKIARRYSFVYLVPAHLAQQHDGKEYSQQGP